LAPPNLLNVPIKIIANKCLQYNDFILNYGNLVNIMWTYMLCEDITISLVIIRNYNKITPDNKILLIRYINS